MIKEIMTIMFFMILLFTPLFAFPIIPNPNPRPKPNKTIIKTAIVNKISNSLKINKKKIKIYDFKRYDNLMFVKVSLNNENYTHVFNIDKLPNRLKRYIKHSNKGNLKRWLRG